MHRGSQATPRIIGGGREACGGRGSKRALTRDDGSSKSVSAVETDTIAACGTVYFDLTSVWRETVGGIFGGDTALEGKAASGDVVLGQAKLLEGSARGNLDLSGNNIDAGDFLGDCVLDLAREVVSGRGTAAWVLECLACGVTHIRGLISIK